MVVKGICNGSDTRALGRRGRNTTSYHGAQGLIEIERLAQLGSAVKLAGGVRAVASRAGLDPSNTSKFLRTARGLSSENVRRLEAVLGKPNCQDLTKPVVNIKVGAVNDDLARALAWYMPDGAWVARASWSGLMSENVRKLVSLNLTPEIYALKDDQGSRLIVTLAAGLIIPASFFHSESPKLRWHNDDRQHAVLNTDERLQEWIDGKVSAVAFDDDWPTHDLDITSDDLINHIRRLNITWREAARRVSYNSTED